MMITNGYPAKTRLPIYLKICEGGDFIEKSQEIN